MLSFEKRTNHKYVENHLKGNHKNCKRNATKKLERLAYLAYELSLFEADDCKESGLIGCKKEIEAISEAVAALRRKRALDSSSHS